MYKYWVDGSVIGIQDLYGPQSVTVKAEGVLLEIESQIGSLKGKLVVWSDSDQVWDGFFFRDHLVGIYALSCLTFDAAKEKLQTLSAREREQYTFNSDPLVGARYIK